MRDYAEGFDVDKMKSALDWVNARGLTAEIGAELVTESEVVFLRMRNNGELWGFAFKRRGFSVTVKEDEQCLINGKRGYIHSVDDHGYCFKESVFR